MQRPRKIVTSARELKAKGMERLVADMVESLGISSEELTVARISAAGLPGLADLADADKLGAAMVGIDPKMTLAGIDTCCGRLEDLAIALLVGIRGERHANAALLKTHGGNAPAAAVHGDRAIEILEQMKEYADNDDIEIDEDTVPPLPPIMATEEIESNIAAIRAAKAKPSRR